jgi:hypothetical protein
MTGMRDSRTSPQRRSHQRRLRQLFLTRTRSLCGSAMQLQAVRTLRRQSHRHRNQLLVLFGNNPIRHRCFIKRPEGLHRIGSSLPKGTQFLQIRHVIHRVSLLIVEISDHARHGVCLRLAVARVPASFDAQHKTVNTELLLYQPRSSVKLNLQPNSKHPQNSVKPLHRETPRQSSRFAWHISSPQPSILNTASETKEQRDQPASFPSRAAGISLKTSILHATPLY